MIKIIIIGIFLLLSGCATISPTEIPKFPTQFSKELMTKCSDLKTVEHDKVALTELVEHIMHNYKLYHECSLKTENWIKWYTEQKKIYNSILNK